MATNRARLVAERTHDRPQRGALFVLLLVLLSPLLVACFAIVVVVAAICWLFCAADPRVADRANDTICGFARAFPRRDVDTLVLRAVWEAAKRAAGMPLRPDAQPRIGAAPATC